MRKKDDERALVACALWLHVGLAFATMSAGGVMLWLFGDTSVVTALAVVVLGVALATASWRRAHEILEHSHRPSVDRVSSVDAPRRSRGGYTTP